MVEKTIRSCIEKYLNREIVTYLICGILTTLLGIIVFWLCDSFGMRVAYSNTISHATAITFAYFVNKIFVFRSKSWVFAVLAREVSTFVTGRLATFAMETLLLIFLVDVLGFDGFICKLFTTVLVFISNYLISKKAVFTGQKIK